MKIEKYSLGVGDRFGHQGEAQLRAIINAVKLGIDLVPVWNKSNREHSYIHSKPSDTRIEADDAVKALSFPGNYYVDADHINLSNVQGFLDSSDFFTLDVASKIGTSSSEQDLELFLHSTKKYSGKLYIPGIDSPFEVSEELLMSIAQKFLAAIKEAGKIYQYIKDQKGAANFITEVSIDEVEVPQTPVELFFILQMIAYQNIPIQTIAPKFTGRFNKGVNYVGDVAQFAKEFEHDVLVIDYAVKEFGLPDNLKLSVHSGSDKFSIYPEISRIIRKYDKGIHVKTAGTTWLEEVIGLALAGGDALDLAKHIYKTALIRQDELCAPYADVIDICQEQLPTAEEVDLWDSQKFANTLRHIPNHPDYNPNFRQLIHVGYKIAAESGVHFTELLEKHHEIIGKCVEENLFERHLKRLFEL